MSRFLADRLLTRGGKFPLVIAHRGASGSVPENTVPAFEAGWASGCGWVEADVQPTSDNVPVILHDADLARTTDGRGSVRDLSCAEVAALDAGSWFRAGGRTFLRTPVPLLTDLVRLLSPERALLLEIKGDHTRDQVGAALDVVRASGWADRVLVQSFQLEALAHVRAIEPDRPVGVLAEELHPDPVAVCRQLGAVTYSPEHLLLRSRPELVAELHSAGIAIMTWTVDESADWEFVHQLGVDAVITNTPGDLLDWQRTRAGTVLD